MGCLAPSCRSARSDAACQSSASTFAVVSSSASTFPPAAAASAMSPSGATTMLPAASMPTWPGEQCYVHPKYDRCDAPHANVFGARWGGVDKYLATLMHTIHRRPRIGYGAGLHSLQLTSSVAPSFGIGALTGLRSVFGIISSAETMGTVGHNVNLHHTDDHLGICSGVSSRQQTCSIMSRSSLQMRAGHWLACNGTLAHLQSCEHTLQHSTLSRRLLHCVRRVLERFRLCTMASAATGAPHAARQVLRFLQVQLLVPAAAFRQQRACRHYSLARQDPHCDVGQHVGASEPAAPTQHAC